MNPKALIPIVAAVFMGLIAAVLARHVIGGRGPATGRAPVIHVAVAKADLPPGHAIAAEDLTLATIVAATPPANGYTETAALVGRVTRTPMIAGQPILETLLAPRGTPDGLQALVPDGMRAITVETTESSGLAGLLSPGSRVDVVTTSTAANDAERSLSRIIAQNVRVLAVGQHLSGTAAPNEPATPTSRTVTLLVTPHDAAALDLALTMARVRLILRGNGDSEEVDDDAVMLAELRGTSTAPTTVMMPGGATPAATQPVVAVTHAEPKRATTQPGPDTTAAVVPAEPPRRIVTLILGDKEQRLSFREQAKPGDATVTDAKDPTDPFAQP